MTIGELIDKLPEDKRAKVREYLGQVTNLPFEAAARIVAYYADGDNRAAYKLLVANMNGEQLDAAMEATNARMKAAKQRVSNEKARTAAFVNWVIQGLMLALQAWLQAQTI